MTFFAGVTSVLQRTIAAGAALGLIKKDINSFATQILPKERRNKQKAKAPRFTLEGLKRLQTANNPPQSQLL